MPPKPLPHHPQPLHPPPSSAPPRQLSLCPQHHRQARAADRQSPLTMTPATAASVLLLALTVAAVAIAHIPPTAAAAAAAAANSQQPPFIDITVPVKAGLPVFQQLGGLPKNWLSRHSLIADGDVCNQAVLTLDAHTGTHVDAPLHFVANGAATETLDLNILIGPALVVALPAGTNITATALKALDLPPHVERVLFKTENSAKRLMHRTAFAPDYVAFDSTGARHVVDHTRLTLVGVDYLSVGCLEDIVETHRILLGKPVVALEGLDLSAAEPGEYELVCLPMALVGSDGAPVRCLLKPHTVLEAADRGSSDEL